MKEDDALPFSKVLIAVDNSECASRAFDYAVRLSKLAGARISVIHVIPPVPATEGIPVAELAEDMAKEGEQLLANIKTRAEIQFGIRVETVLGNGNPSKVILATTNDIGADLIVMGSSGMGGVKEFLLGSVSHAVSNHAQCPVLIVK